MKIGIPSETKVKERRVSCTPGGVRMLAQHGHEVLVQKGAGEGSGFADELYTNAGATLVATAEDAWAAEMVVKVKEPIAPEFQYLREDLILFTYLHLAAAPELTKKLVETKTTGIAYETVEVGRRLPLLEPMSEIAGRMSAIVGAYYLAAPLGGKGVLLGGVPGVLPGKVLVIGGGTAGINAGGSRRARRRCYRPRSGPGAHALSRRLAPQRGPHALLERTESARHAAVGRPGHRRRAGSGAKAPHLIRREMLDVMKPGSVSSISPSTKAGAPRRRARRRTTIRSTWSTILSTIAWRICRAPTRGPRPRR